MAIDFPNSPTVNQTFTSGSTTWVWDGTAWNLQTTTTASNDSMPVGSIMWFAGSTAPTGWILCNGATYTNSTYPNLVAVIGTTFGGTPGTNFMVPNISATTGAYYIRFTTAVGVTSTLSLLSAPVGSMVQWPVTSSYPTGWLRCDGSNISRTSFADLFALIGTTYGAGDGSTTFTLPNLAAAGTGSPVYIIKATSSGLVEPSTVSHAASHIRSGSDIIDGDRVQVDWVPTYYTRDSSPVQAGVVTDLAAHLKGLDNYFNSFLRIRQVISTNYSTETSTTSQTLTNTGLNLSITPTSTNSKILVIATTPIRVDNSPNTGYYEAAGVVTLRRDSTNIQSHGVGGNLWINGTKAFFTLSSFVYIDSPNTTSTINYKTMIKSSAPEFRIYSNNSSVYGSGNLDTTVSQLILVEIL